MFISPRIYLAYLLATFAFALTVERNWNACIKKTKCIIEDENFSECAGNVK